MADKVLQQSIDMEPLFSSKVTAGLEKGAEFSVLAVRAHSITRKFSNLTKLTGFRPEMLYIKDCDNCTSEYFPLIEKENESVKYFLDTKNLTRYSQASIATMKRNKCNEAPVICILLEFFKAHLLRIVITVSYASLLTCFFFRNRGNDTVVKVMS